MYTQKTVCVADLNIDLNPWHSQSPKSTHGTLTHLSNNKRKNHVYTNKGVLLWDDLPVTQLMVH